MPSELVGFYSLCVGADAWCMLQVKPEPEDTAMTVDSSPSSLPIAQQAVKAEPSTQAPADPPADLPDTAVPQAGGAAGGGGGNPAAMPPNAGGTPPAGGLTPESSAQVVQGTS